MARCLILEMVCFSVLLLSCGGSDGTTADPDVGVAAAEKQIAVPSGEPVPGLMMVQAQFIQVDGKPVPGPAKMVLLQQTADGWLEEVVEDPESNVFHKAMWWNEGILTIGAMAAKLVHWQKQDTGWEGTTLWERSWGGKFDRLRDVEIGDVNGDGMEDIVIATHDKGVVAVGSQGDSGWNFHEMNEKADTFVHEIEIGDVDGDGKAEFYATPSERNRASGVSQPGSVVQYAWDGKEYTTSKVVTWEHSHAKEILVANVDGKPGDELYVVREAHVEKDASGVTNIVSPVAILRVQSIEGVWKSEEIATLDDRQCRFLISGDVDGDGRTDLVAAAMSSGLWWLKQREDGSFGKILIDAASGGFEHASHMVDLDGDGRSEIYVAADNQKELREYSYNGASFDRRRIARLGDAHITWNIQDGVF